MDWAYINHAEIKLNRGEGVGRPGPSSTLVLGRRAGPSHLETERGMVGALDGRDPRVLTALLEKLLLSFEGDENEPG